MPHNLRRVARSRRTDMLHLSALRLEQADHRTESSLDSVRFGRLAQHAGGKRHHGDETKIARHVGSHSKLATGSE
jgi:hypothetical protein